MSTESSRYFPVGHKNGHDIRCGSMRKPWTCARFDIHTNHIYRTNNRIGCQPGLQDECLHARLNAVNLCPLLPRRLRWFRWCRWCRGTRSMRSCHGQGLGGWAGIRTGPGYGVGCGLGFGFGCGFPGIVCIFPLPVVELVHVRPGTQHPEIQVAGASFQCVQFHASTGRTVGVEHCCVSFPCVLSLHTVTSRVHVLFPMR